MELTQKLSPSISKTLKQTYGLMAAMILVTQIVTAVLVSTGFIITNGLAILGLALLSFGLIFVAFNQNSYIALSALFGFAVLKGVMLTSAIAATSPLTIMIALTLTIAIFTFLSLYVILTGKDFTGIGNYLLGALVLLIIVSIVNLFVGMPISQVVISYFAVLLFSGMILYDTSLITEGKETNPIIAAISMYLNLLNIFISLINIIDND